MRSAFLSTYMPFSVQATAGTGINYLLPLAVAYLESAAGTNTLAREANNLHSIKAGKSWQGPKFILLTPEYKRGQKVQELASFRKYSSPLDSFKDFVKLMSLPRYKAVKQQTTLLGQIAALAAAGYATDPAYKNKLESVAGALRKVTNVKTTASAGSFTGALVALTAGAGAFIIYKLVKNGQQK